MFNKRKKARSFHASSRPIKINSYKKRKRLTRNKSSISPRISRPKRPSKGKKIFSKLFLFAAIIFVVYISVFSSYFNVQKIQNTNKELLNTVLADEINATVEEYKDKNLILISTQKVAEKIIASFPELEEVKVYKDYPNTIGVEFKEFSAAANLINETGEIKKSYILNSIGYAIIENDENPNLPYIKIKSDEPINTDKAAIDKAKLSYILETKAYFEEKFGMRIKEVIYKPIPREIHLLTERDFFVWIDIQVDYEIQLKKLKKALVKLDIANENLQYIDLRIAGLNGDKIIYKRR